MSRKNTYYKKPSRRARRRRRRLIRRIILIVIIIVLVLGGIYAWRKLDLGARITGGIGASREASNVTEYYGLTDEESMIVTVNRERSEQNGIYRGGEAYLPLSVVQSQISNRFFWDASEGVLRYVTPTDLVSTEALDTTAYTIGKEEKNMDNVIALAGDDSIYLSASFIEQFADIRYQTAQDPNRIAISNEWGKLTYSRLKHTSSLREKGGRRSNVICKLDKDTLVSVTEEFENWVGVTTEDGLTGYLQKSDLGEETSKTYTSSKGEETFSHIQREETICMAWHQVTNTAANAGLETVLSQTKGINVLSPTWFYLNDNKGGIESFASADYVNACHNKGIEVWGLVSNLENTSVNTATVLNKTSSRDALVNNLVGAAIQYGLDGINVDFEALSGDVGYGFIEFIRELSIKCRNNDLVLSVDNYPPSSYTQLYYRDEQARFADYVVLMAYDEHFNGSEEDGSVSSLPYVNQSVTDTLKEVPANQLIMGLPFYTRLWKTDAQGLTSQTMGMAEAQKAVSDNQAEKTWLSDLGQYFAEYDRENAHYTIWLEDEDSIAEKMKVLRSEDLAGVSFWKLGYEESSIWNVIGGYLQ